MTDTQTDREEIQTLTTSVRKITKYAVQGLAGAGAGRLAKGFFDNNLPAPKSKFQALGNVVGTWAVGGIVIDKTRVYTNEKVDAFFDLVDYVVHVVNVVEEEGWGAFTDDVLDSIQFNATTDIQGETVDQPTTQA